MVPGKKKALSRLLMSTGLFRVVDALAAPSLTIFNFHRIRAKSAGGGATQFDDDVFGPTVDEFRAQMIWLKSHSTILSESELLDSLRSGSSLPRRSTMVTFDDGYADNYELALPVLKELGVPAIFFIPTQAIQERTLGWWDLIAYVLKKTRRESFEFRGETHAVGEGMEQRRALMTRFQRMMKLTPASESQSLVEELARACGVELPTREVCGRELMTWDQVCETARSGVVSIGSHTHSHRVLATLDAETQRQELLRSKSELESRIGRPVRTLAYPVGGYEHFKLETKRIAGECGFEAAFSFHTGINRLGEGTLDRFDLRRLSAPEDASLYCATLALPGLYGKRRCEASAPA